MRLSRQHQNSSLQNQVHIPPPLSLSHIHTHSTMAPSLEEPTQMDLDAPLKAAPKLVAPEPGAHTPPPLSLTHTHTLHNGTVARRADANGPRCASQGSTKTRRSRTRCTYPPPSLSHTYTHTPQWHRR